MEGPLANAGGACPGSAATSARTTNDLRDIVVAISVLARGGLRAAAGPPRQARPLPDQAQPPPPQPACGTPLANAPAAPAPPSTGPRRNSTCDPSTIAYSAQGGLR